jgi:dephospho-CoA kinase
VPRRLRIGLTGGIASGKSTAAQRFAELGAAVVDADEAARAVVAPGQAGLVRVAAAFGAGVLTPDGGLDRQAMRELIFRSPHARRELECILHPLIRAEMERRAAGANGAYLIMAIPLLVEVLAREAGEPRQIDRVLVVDVDEPEQIERVMQRDRCSREQASSILAAQAGRAARLAAADDVLHNTGTVTDLRQAVDQLHARYLQMAARMAGGAAPAQS